MEAAGHQLTGPAVRLLHRLKQAHTHVMSQ